MAFSSTDFTSNIINHLFDNGLIKSDVAQSDDLEYQASTVIEVFNNLVQRQTDEEAPAAKQQCPSVPARFMGELLDANETLTDIADIYGARTLADCMYMLSALEKGSLIEVHHPTESRVLDVIHALPSATLWMNFVREVTE